MHRVEYKLHLPETVLAAVLGRLAKDRPGWPARADGFQLIVELNDMPAHETAAAVVELNALTQFYRDHLDNQTAEPDPRAMRES
jgi:hypothetical protein